MKKHVSSAVLLGLVLATACSTAPASRTLDLIDDQAASDLDWVEHPEDRALILELAKAGQPRVTKKSDRCLGKMNDEVGAMFAGVPLCLSQIKVSSAVMRELIINNDQRFVNESDYDQRVTKLYAFKHDGTLDRFLTDHDVRALLTKFSAKVSMDTEHSKFYFNTSEPSEKSYLRSLKGLFVGSQWMDVTESYDFVRQLLSGEAVKSVTAPYEVVLYPGGGFTTKFEFLISKSFIIFVKTEGWNS